MSSGPSLSSSAVQPDSILVGSADNPAVNRMTITVLAAVAEHERKQISERTKQALAARKARGLPLGMAAIHAYREAHQLPPAAATNLKNRAAGTARSAVVNRVKAQDQARDLAGSLAELRAGGATSLRQIATGLNDRRIPTTRGGAWTAKPAVSSDERSSSSVRKRRVDSESSSAPSGQP